MKNKNFLSHRRLSTLRSPHQPHAVVNTFTFIKMFAQTRSTNGTDPLITLKPAINDSMQAYPPPPPTTVATRPTPTTQPRRLLCRIAIIVSSLVALNIILLVALAFISLHYPKFSSPGILAFTFGLRHAVDADHIAAIDNVSRKLISDGKTPLLVGFYFSVGHSTVVTLLCAGVAFGSNWLRKHLNNVKSVGAIVGTSVSALVLLIVAAMNIVVAWRLIVAWRKLTVARQRRRQEKDTTTTTTTTTALTTPLLASSSSSLSGPQSSYVDPTSGLSFVMGNAHEHDDGAPAHTHMIVVDVAGRVAVASEDSNSGLGGCFTKCCPRIFGAVDASWKMYPIGFLFGLGFDTASEVALLGLTAMNSSTIPSSLILVLPLLFAAGMSLIDTLDGILMLYAYSWASVDKKRRLFFNLYLTIVSAFIAIVVATVEVLGLLSSELSLTHGWFWSGVSSINEHFEYVGYSILGFFGLSMVCAAVLFKCCLGEGEGESGGGVGGGVGRGVGIERSSNNTADTLILGGETKTVASKRAKEADYLRKRMLNMARGNVQAIDI